jgi:hypothetical protein
VEVETGNKRILIGTDDPDGLTDFLKSKTAG